MFFIVFLHRNTYMDEFKILLNCNISGGESFDYNSYELLMKYCGCYRCCSNNDWINLT